MGLHMGYSGAKLIKIFDNRIKKTETINKKHLNEKPDHLIKNRPYSSFLTLTFAYENNFT